MYEGVLEPLPPAVARVPLNVSQPEKAKRRHQLADVSRYGIDGKHDLPKFTS